MFFWKKVGGTRFRGSRCGPDGSKMGEISMSVRVWSPRDNHRSFQNDFLCVKKVSYHILRWWKKVSHMVSHRESFLHPFQKSRIDFHRFFRYKLLIRCKWLTIWLTTCMPKVGKKFFFCKTHKCLPIWLTIRPPLSTDVRFLRNILMDPQSMAS